MMSKHFELFCARCRGPVQHLALTRNLALRSHQLSFSCHGDSSSLTIPDEEIEKLSDIMTDPAVTKILVTVFSAAEEQAVDATHRP